MIFQLFEDGILYKILPKVMQNILFINHDFVWSSYDIVTFLQNTHNRHLIADQWGVLCEFKMWSKFYFSSNIFAHVAAKPSAAQWVLKFKRYFVFLSPISLAITYLEDILLSR